MPYISKTARPGVRKTGADNAGELNFLITDAIVQYMEHNGLVYQTINDILGALEGAKLEFYRRVAVPYEDSKIAQNGDVYPSGWGLA